MRAGRTCSGRVGVGGMTCARVPVGLGSDYELFGRPCPAGSQRPGSFSYEKSPYCYGPSTSGCMPTSQRIRSRLLQMPAVRRCGQCRGPWHVARFRAGSRAVIKNIH